MQTHPHNTFSLTFSSFLLLLLSPPLLAARTTPQDAVHSSCAQARYPTLCVQTVSNKVGPTMKPLDMALASVKVTLSKALTLSLYLKTLKVSTNRQRVALSDCKAQISVSVTQLNMTLNELRHIRTASFQWQMSNAMTWASTALTNGNACINGFTGSDADGKLKLTVKRRVTDVAMLTSNSLYMIHRLGESRSGKSSSNSKN